MILKREKKNMIIKIGSRVKVVKRNKKIAESYGRVGVIQVINNDYPPDPNGEHYWVKTKKNFMWYYKEELKVLF